MTKTSSGNFFEDFYVGQVMHHATPRTLAQGDASLYLALYGSRFALQSSAPFAQALGYPDRPVDDWLVFHTVFGKTVPDISLNAVANLGYAAGRFLKPVFAGDTLSAVSEVIGVKENSSAKTGVVYVRSRGLNQHGDVVLDYIRWVMVRKRDPASKAPDPIVPELPDHVPADSLGAGCPRLHKANWDKSLSGSPHLFDDYQVGETIDHVDGITVEEAEHMTATRLYQNTAKVHFNQHTEGQGRFGRRLIYGGHVISLVRALSYNGLANAFHIAGLNSGSHVAPLFAGDTVFAWTRIAAAEPVKDRDDVGALRLISYATKNLPCRDLPSKQDGGYADGVILELDYWVLIPRA